MGDYSDITKNNKKSPYMTYIPLENVLNNRLRHLVWTKTYKTINVTNVTLYVTNVTGDICDDSIL